MTLIPPYSLEDLNNVKLCSLENCNKKHYGLGFCRNHYRQYKTRENQKINRTIKTPNEVRIKRTYAEIVLYDKECNEVGVSKIDLEDVEKVSKYKWFINVQGYVNNNKIGRLHRFLLNAPKDKVVDHINGDKLDNRKCNIRLVTTSQNGMNKSSKANNSSGRLGVCYDKTRNKWRAYITVNYKTIDLGIYSSKQEAIKFRLLGERLYFGEYKSR